MPRGTRFKLEEIIAKALTDAENQRSALTTQTTQGFLAIDNNPAERALKPIALGRKNRLFAGGVSAAQHVRLASLIASAARHGVDPQRYLTSVLAKISQTPEEELGQGTIRRSRSGATIERPGLAERTHLERKTIHLCSTGAER